MPNSYIIPEEQGQIVYSAYSWGSDGWVYRCDVDKSDRSEAYYRARPDWDREGEEIVYERAPYIVGEWQKCSFEQWRDA